VKERKKRMEGIGIFWSSELNKKKEDIGIEKLDKGTTPFIVVNSPVVFLIPIMLNSIHA